MSQEKSFLGVLALSELFDNGVISNEINKATEYFKKILEYLYTNNNDNKNILNFIINLMDTNCIYINKTDHRYKYVDDIINNKKNFYVYIILLENHATNISIDLSHNNKQIVRFGNTGHHCIFNGYFNKNVNACIEYIYEVKIDNKIVASYIYQITHNFCNNYQEFLNNYYMYLYQMTIELDFINNKNNDNISIEEQSVIKDKFNELVDYYYDKRKNKHDFIDQTYEVTDTTILNNKDDKFEDNLKYLYIDEDEENNNNNINNNINKIFDECVKIKKFFTQFDFDEFHNKYINKNMYMFEAQIFGDCVYRSIYLAFYFKYTYDTNNINTIYMGKFFKIYLMITYVTLVSFLQVKLNDYLSNNEIETLYKNNLLFNNDEIYYEMNNMVEID